MMASPDFTRRRWVFFPSKMSINFDLDNWDIPKAYLHYNFFFDSDQSVDHWYAILMEMNKVDKYSQCVPQSNSLNL